jgi:hypothetical protein
VTQLDGLVGSKIIMLNWLRSPMLLFGANDDEVGVLAWDSFDDGRRLEGAAAAVVEVLGSTADCKGAALYLCWYAFCCGVGSCRGCCKSGLCLFCSCCG